MQFSVFVCAVGWAAGWVLLGRARSVSALTEPGSSSRHGLTGVLVVVPARNEEESIERLLDGLTDPGDPTAGPVQIVVVDDHSTDRTAELAGRHAGVEVLSAPDLPEGWTGKCWACHTGATHGAARGGVDTLVFLDADVRTNRGALARVVAERDRCGGLVSVQPWHETERPHEQLSCLFNVLAIMGTAVGSRRGATGAFGPLLVTSSQDYASVGGHEAVRHEVVEDLALAQRFRARGLPVEVVEGGRDVRFRMYPQGVRQLVEGWTKNFAVGAGATRPLRLAAIVWWIASLGTAAFALDDSLRGDLTPALGVALYLAFVVQCAVMFRQVGSFGGLTALVYPIPLAFFIAVFVRSLWCTHVRRSVEWRGRSVSTAPGRR